MTIIFKIFTFVFFGATALEFAHARPSQDEIKSLFPEYKNEFMFSKSKPENHRSRRGVTAYPGIEMIIGKNLVTEISKDLDGDGILEFIFIGKFKAKDQRNPKKMRSEFLLGVLKLKDKIWQIVDHKVSGNMNIVSDAFLIDIPNGFEIYILERRGQCDDEKIEHYQVTWDPKKQMLIDPFQSKNLHPFKRDWNCGE
ncbi:MAG: hypothetical protein AABZ55_14790 [Bdellovibrionota bacterium]